MSAWIVLACLWFHGTSVDGGEKRVGGEDASPRRYFQRLTDHTAHEERVQTAPGPTPPADAPWEVQSDHAALLVYQGRAAEAITLLEAVEARHPGQYAVAANLGTAYELAGKNEEARRWILEGIRRNPESHEGTEWLHVRILDAKIALARDPDWLRTHSVLGLDFGTDATPSLPLVWPEGQDAASTLKALEYQLHERMGFIRPPDAMVGDLLADFGSLLALKLTVEHSLPVFRLALQYRPTHADQVRRRHAALADVVETRQFWIAAQNLAVAAGVVALLGLLAFLIIRRRRKRRRRGDIPAARVISG